MSLLAPDALDVVVDDLIGTIFGGALQCKSGQFYLEWRLIFWKQIKNKNQNREKKKLGLYQTYLVDGVAALAVDITLAGIVGIGTVVFELTFVPLAIIED